MRKVAILIIALAFVAIPSIAQTIPGTIGFDLVPGTPSFSGSNVVDTDSDIDLATTVNANANFKTLVRLNGTTNLLGASFDFAFDKAKLNVRNIRETRADIDFSGTQSFNEITAVVNWFAANTASGAKVDTFTYTYNDGTGSITTSPGVVLDVDGSGGMSFNEITAYVTEYAANASGTDIPFWTEVINKHKNRGEGGQTFKYNESVEVFDRVADINATGVAEDNTVVLLARPEDGRDTSGVLVPGYGFDGNAILLEVEFKALAGTSGQTANITISNAVGIDESFQSLADVKPIANIAGPSVVTIN
jgi:hypothetical protein